MKHEFFSLLSDIVEGICEHKGELRIDQEEEKHCLTLNVRPHMADYPKLVGKKGRQVNAFTHLTERYCILKQDPVTFKLTESFEGRREPATGFCYNRDFDVEKLRAMLAKMIHYVTNRSPAIEMTEDGDVLIAQVQMERTAENETTIGAVDAVFYPYCHALGRKLKMRVHKA